MAKKARRQRRPKKQDKEEGQEVTFPAWAEPRSARALSDSDCLSDSDGNVTKTAALCRFLIPGFAIARLDVFSREIGMAARQVSCQRAPAVSGSPDKHRLLSLPKRADQPDRDPWSRRRRDRRASASAARWRSSWPRAAATALADRDEAGLQTLAAEISRAYSQKISIHRVDVSEPSQIEAFALAAISVHPGLNIVVNNAGVALLGQFDEIDQAQMEWLMKSISGAWCM